MKLSLTSYSKSRDCPSKPRSHSLSNFASVATIDHVEQVPDLPVAVDGRVVADVQLPGVHPVNLEDPELGLGVVGSNHVEPRFGLVQGNSLYSFNSWTEQIGLHFDFFLKLILRIFILYMDSFFVHSLKHN